MSRLPAKLPDVETLWVSNPDQGRRLPHNAIEAFAQVFRIACSEAFIEHHDLRILEQRAR